MGEKSPCLARIWTNELSASLRMRLIESQRDRANFLFELLELLFQSSD